MQIHSKQGVTWGGGVVIDRDTAFPTAVHVSALRSNKTKKEPRLISGHFDTYLWRGDECPHVLGNQERSVLPTKKSRGAARTSQVLGSQQLESSTFKTSFVQHPRGPQPTPTPYGGQGHSVSPPIPRLVSLAPRQQPLEKIRQGPFSYQPSPPYKTDRLLCQAVLHYD